jgi:hypothetical protein
MNENDVILLMAWTSMVVLAVAVLLAVAGLAVRFGVLSLPSAVRSSVRAGALPLAAVVATAATASSLWLSEVAEFIPCDYCWYQRIAMYPLALILIIAAISRDLRIWRYALPLSAIGLALSCYHYWLQVRPDDAPSTCTTGVPCSVRYVDELGVVSIPWMAGCCFLLVGVLMMIVRAIGRSTPPGS